MNQNINEVWTTLNDALYNFIRSNIKDNNLTNDILHDVFLKVHSNIDSLKDEEKIISWIYQITRNTITDYYRRQKIKLQPKYLELINAEENDTQNVTKEFSQCIISMVNTLPEKYKEALILSEIEGLSQKKLAEKLDISYSGAKSRVQRGREKLKELLLNCCSITKDKFGNILDYKQKKCSNQC